jgi:DUF1707 SHOCT-like domain
VTRGFLRGILGRMSLTQLPATAVRSVRASDADRDRAAEDLRRHYAAGRLSETELEERLARVYAARCRSQLAPLLRDLPSNRSLRAWRGFYRWQRVALKYHAASYASINATLVGIWALTGEGAFWPAWVLAPGTVMLAWHAALSRMLRRSLGLPPRPDRVRLDRARAG